MTTFAQIRDLVREQIAMVSDSARRRALEALVLDEPRLEERPWDYGKPGEHLPYWVVAEEPGRGIILVYCDEGFGPEFPWGFLFTGDARWSSLGMDSQWAWYLEEAFVRAGLWPDGLGDDEVLHLPPEERFRTDRGAEA